MVFWTKIAQNKVITTHKTFETKKENIHMSKHVSTLERKNVFELDGTVKSLQDTQLVP